MSNVWCVKLLSGDVLEVMESLDGVDGRRVVTLTQRRDDRQVPVFALSPDEACQLGLMLLEASKASGERKAKLDAAIALQGERNRIAHRDDVPADEKPAIERPAKKRAVADKARAERGQIMHAVRADNGETVQFVTLGSFTAGVDTLVSACRICAKVTLSKSTREVQCGGPGCGATGCAFVGVLVEKKKG